MIQENVIEAIILNISENEDELEAYVEDLQEEQPVIANYLFSETFEAFTDSERSYALYLSLILWQVIRSQANDPLSPGSIQPEDLVVCEEENWDQIQASSGGNFRQRLDGFFDQTNQEDLLAFIEDALEIDESDAENVVTKEGREGLFVSLKSIMDCLLKSYKIG